MTYPYVGPVAHFNVGDNRPINRIVIHCTAGGAEPIVRGSARGTASYFRSSSATGSAQYVTDAYELVQCAHDDVICWHAPPNAHSIGIEIVCTLDNDGQGHWTRADHVAAMQRAARLVAELCQAYDVPAVKLGPADLLADQRGVCGHVDVSSAWHQTTHTDPGPYFPWPVFMGYVHANLDGSIDMNLNDAVPGLKDSDGTAVTVGEALIRAQYAYSQIINGGDVRTLINRGAWAYDQTREGGSLDQRLDGHTDQLAAQGEKLADHENRLGVLETPKA